MKQPLFAPVAAGGSIVAGVAAMLIGGYRVVDCITYKSGYGACDEVVDNNMLAMVAGGSAITGVLGGLFTYNRKLERPDPENLPDRDALAGLTVRSTPPPLPPLQQDPRTEPDEEELERLIRYYDKYDWSQERIAEQLNITRYQVRKVLTPDNV